jgi:histidine ammonia-lyase
MDGLSASAVEPPAAAEGHPITLDFYRLADFRNLLEERPALTLDAEVAERIDRGARFVQRKAGEDRYIYGVNTGFGSLCETRVASDEMEKLQHNHVVSHACGVGDAAPDDVSRLTLLIKLLTFRSGHTGVSRPTVERLVELWNRDIVPVIPQRGTVGASGDLAPLAHMALPLLGLGQVRRDGEVVPGDRLLAEMGWQPLRLLPKEGLALTNGVQYINAWAVHSLLVIEELVRVADVVAALSLQGFSASRTFYHRLYHETSHHRDRKVVAENLRRLLEGSNHYELPSCNRSQQDPYSFRCLPQVHAAVRQSVRHAVEVVEDEVNGVSDNPLFFPDDDEILFGGNLHGESTAIVLDLLAIAVTELASISERRTYQLLSGKRGLPDFLVRAPGLNSGFMIPQYTSAALVNECKVLSNPASVDTIATCQLQEDHVSMGGTSAYKLARIVENCEYVLAIELLTAAQAIELNAGLRLSPRTEEVHRALRRRVPPLVEDRVMSTDMEAARDLLCQSRREWSRGVE